MKNFHIVLILLGAMASWPLSVQAQVSAQVSPQVSPQVPALTEEQRHYLETRAPIPFCVDPDWAPYEVVNSAGEHEGIAADLLRLAAQRAGVTLELVVTADWKESLAAAWDGRCRMLSFLNRTPAREEWLTFTEPLFFDPNVIVTREEHPYVTDLSSEGRKVMALPRGTSIEERVRRDFPEIEIVNTDNEGDAFAMVSKGQADMTLRSLSVSIYTIKRMGWFNLKVAGQVPGYDNQLRAAVLKTDAPLAAILDRGIATITPQERREIANRHVAFVITGGIDHDLLIKAGAVFGVILLTSLFWGMRLRRLNERLKHQSRTDALTGLANRAHLNQRMGEEIERARRYGRPFAVIMLDIDHFKQVNDTLGHMAGDRVLADFAGIMRGCARALDTVGRWGGEEFLVLCSESSAEQAATLAERIREALRTGGRDFTVSAGVAELAPDDTCNGLLLRADQALYEAKAAGRDRVKTR